MEHSCNICIESYNKSTHRQVTCNYCEYSVCRTCFCKCLLNTVLDPHCVSCKNFFSIDFINDNCTKIFVNGPLKEHRTAVLMERERALLPATQPLASREKQRKIINKEINDLYLERYNLTTSHRIKISNINYSINQCYFRLRNIENVENISEQQSSKGNLFVRKCPISDCRGFLNGKFICGTCESVICRDCNESITALNVHVCNPEHVKTMELLRRDTKPCPSCGCMITKIPGGCDQMFCMECHNAFSWSKGTIERGVIHNPHYYEFVRSQNNGVIPRNPGDQLCGGLPGIYHFIDLLRSYLVQRTIITKLSNLHRTVVHIQHAEIRNIPNDNINLRVKYINNEISENEFKRTIELNERKRQKFTKLNELNTMFTNVCTEILILIVNYKPNNDPLNGTSKDFIQMINEQLIIIHNLINYYNDHISRICKFYKCVSPGISTDYYDYHSNYENYLKNKQN